MVSPDDGFRFVFIQESDKRVVMKDELEEFPNMTLPRPLAEKLASMLNEQHFIQYDKENSLMRFKGILEIVEDKQNKIDKDILIAVINNLNFTEVSE
jgi:hypothetical protein